MIIILHILTLAVFAYFLVSTLYLLVFALAGRSGRQPVFPKSTRPRKAVVLIPAFQEDDVIIETARSAAAQYFEGGAFRVIIIADKLQPRTVAKLEALAVTVQRVSFEVSGKARSLHAALHLIDPLNEDFVFILDADNIAGAGCLDRINNAFDQGYEAIQLHRTAKNTNTPIALLDAISEEINLNIFRRGAFNLGLSAAPMGSGMAFSTRIFRDIFSQQETIESANEDRQIENYLIEHNTRLGYIDEALVYDEKVSSAGVLKKQRTRWMEAQLHQLRRFIGRVGSGNKTSAQYYHSFFQTMLLPRVFYLALSGIICLVISGEWILGEVWLYPGKTIWLTLVALYSSVLIISVPSKYYTLRTVQAVFSLPFVILTMIAALLHLKKRRKEFLHTSKSFVAKD